MGKEKGFSAVIVLVCLILFVAVAAVAIYFYNPFERSRVSRDEQREKDLTELEKAIKLYLRNNSREPKMCNDCLVGKDVFTAAPIGLNDSEVIVKGSNTANGTGWVPIDFSLNAGINETPLLLLPTDPKNTDPYVYTFTPGENGNFKLTASFESKAFLDKMVQDGGSNPNRFEIGPDLNLPPN